MNKIQQQILNYKQQYKNHYVSFIKKDNDLFNAILDQTNFLGTNDCVQYPFYFRISLILNNINSIPLCPTCGKKLEYSKSKRRFKYHCNSSCAAKDPNVKQKLEQTNLIRHGCLHYNNHDKQKQTMIERYGVESALYGNTEFRKKGRQTLFDKYGKYNFPDKTTETCKKRYGTGRNNNKAKQTMLNKYGVSSYLLTDVVKNIRNNVIVQSKIQNTKLKNKTFNASKLEEVCYKMLVEKFGKDDIIRQYTSELYPFNCDFYIKSLDLYIEYNGSWTHGKHPFDPTNKDDIEIVEKWKAKNKKYYFIAINTWTKRDVNKRNVAKQNNINIKEFWKVSELEEFLKDLSK